MNDKKYVTPEIYYIDNFLPLDFIDNLSSKLLMSSWFMHSSNVEKYPGSFFWATSLEQDTHGEEIQYFKRVFNDAHILRVYANGQSSTQHGDFHRDDGERTYLIGMSKKWNIDSGGGTEFIINQGEGVTTTIYPKYNRLISFPANIEHRALPNIKLEEFRITLALKTKSIESKDLIENDKKNINGSFKMINFLN